MVWEIPYTFIAGTKAKANEVNGNFTSIKQFVDQLESNLATAELDINNLETNKADINGNQDEVFQVADAENNKDAVNLETLKAQTANTLDVIRGFVPSKSNKNTISCTAGDCWDSTYEVIINSSTSLSLQDTTLAASTTYYIYVCYDKETSTCKLTFSTNNTTPTLPAGFDNFRRIGSFITDGDGVIDVVSAEGSVDLNNRIGFIGSNIGGQITSSTTYTADQNHWVYARVGYREKANTTITVTIDGIEVAYMRSGWKYDASSSVLIPVRKGQNVVITITNRNSQSYVQKISMT